ncbi:acetate--CoA ligase family protein, partial [Candidatus Aerophobetes bacterium]|nr:acetate--CoA ligase family protein [Candidatus Aerophobetes bacterium]
MRLYEFESKKILSSYGIPVPKGRVVTSFQEARIFAQEVAGPIAL